MNLITDKLPLLNKRCFILLYAIGFSLKTIAGTVGGKDTLVNIPFGKNNVIKYHLNSGTWDVVFNGKLVIVGAYATYKGEKAFTTRELGPGKYTISDAADVKLKQRTIEWKHDGMQIEQVFNVTPLENYFITELIVTGQHVAAAYSAPITAARVVMASAGDNRALAVPFDNDMWVRFNAQPLQQANFTSSEVTALYNNDNYHGLVIGSMKHDEWKTGITVKAGDAHTVTVTAFGGLADSNITHDKIPHGKVLRGNTQCISPFIMVGLYDDWRSGMEKYASAHRDVNLSVIAKWKKATPVGWNSWGALQTKLTLDKAKGVIDFFSDSCKGFRNADSTLYIDMDSFWDNLIKGGLDGDVSQLVEFVRYCKSKGFRPGVYWAPFTDWGKSDRKMEGSTYNYAQAWTRQNGQPIDLDGAYALDPTHPATKARIAWCLNHLKKLGFEMIKIDFLGHGALECDHFYDPAVTTGMQAYRDGMTYVDSVLDNSMLVYAAISPTMATAPYVHMRRIACDAFSAIDNTEYTLNSTGYGWWQSYLYNYVDADHVVFNKESEGANRARLTSALVTGTLITGDDYAAAGPWRQTALRWLQHKGLLKVIKDGHSFRPLEANTGNKAVELFIKPMGRETYLAVFNYSNSPRSFNLSSSRLGFKRENDSKMVATDLFSRTTSTWYDDWQFDVPASDAKIYILSNPGH